MIKLMITQLVSARAKTQALSCAPRHCAVLWVGGCITALFKILCTFSINCYMNLNITDLSHVLGNIIGHSPNPSSGFILVSQYVSPQAHALGLRKGL